MENTRKEFYDIGWLLIFLAILNAFQFLITRVRDLMSNADAEVFKNLDPSLHDLATIVLVTLLGITTLSVIIQLFLGARAIHISQEPTTARAHIHIGVFVLILNIISSLSLIVSLFNSGDLVESIVTLLLQVANTLIMIFYVKDAKKIRKAKLQEAK